jgi:membrane-associated protease RseP (regulator of RpoE activity)
MKVTEFFLFFGPKIWSFHRGETEYGVKCIPLGAYVRIIGMSNVDTDVPPEDEPRTYRQQSYPKRVLVASAGSLMHLLQALVLFFLAFSIVGVPGGSYWAEELGGPPASWTVDQVSEDSGAEAAGIQPGDQIVSIAGEPVQAWEDVGDAVVPRAGDTVTIELVRDGQPLELQATIGSRSARAGEPGREAYGFLGIGPEFQPMAAYRVDPITGIAGTVEATADITGKTFQGLAAFFTGGVDDLASDVAEGGKPAPPAASGDTGTTISEDDANRPLSIFGIARFGAGVFEEGIAGFLILMAVVNISIGLLNMIPLLPLDGGHVAIATYERIRSIGRRERYMADVSRLLPITYAVFMFMVLLGMSTIYLDIVDPVG